MKVIFENNRIRICKNPNTATFQPKYKFFVKEIDEFENEYWSSSDETPGLVTAMADALVSLNK